VFIRFRQNSGISNGQKAFPPPQSFFKGEAVKKFKSGRETFLVVQGAKKFAPPKSAGHFPSPKGPLASAGERLQT
jgi:hypothetical protein